MDKYNNRTVPAPTLIQNNKKENNQTVFDVDEIWKVVKEQLRLYLSETSVKTWYPNVYLEKIEAGIAEISCDTQYKREWIDTNNRAILKKILYSATGQNLDIMLTLRSAVRRNIQGDFSNNQISDDHTYNGARYEAGGVSEMKSMSQNDFQKTHDNQDSSSDNYIYDNIEKDQEDLSQFQSSRSTIITKSDQIQDFKSHIDTNPEILISKPNLEKNYPPKISEKNKNICTPKNLVESSLSSLVNP